MKITGRNMTISEEAPRKSTQIEKLDANGNVNRKENKSLDSRTLEPTETGAPSQHHMGNEEPYPAVDYHDAEEKLRCYYWLEMVESELRQGCGRKLVAWRHLKEFLTVMGQRNDLNPRSNDSLTAYCTDLWMRDEYMQTLVLLSAWLDLFASAKSGDEFRKSDIIGLYIDYLAVTTEKLMIMGAGDRQIAIEFGLPILEDALPKLSDMKINVVEEVSVRKIRRIVADIYRMQGKNPPWESEETSRAIQIMLDHLQRPLDDIGYAFRSLFLYNLMKIQEDRSVDYLVELAECELHLNRGREKQVLRDLQDILRSYTVIGRLSVRAKINDLWNTEHRLKLFVYTYVWCDLFSRDDLLSDAGYADTVLQNTVNLELSMRKLVKTGGDEQRIAIEYGLSKMTDMIQNLLSSRIANDEITSLQNRIVFYKTLDLMDYDLSHVRSEDDVNGESSVLWLWLEQCLNFMSEYQGLFQVIAIAIATIVLHL